MKRIYDSPGTSDGVRILVDRLWPRGIAKSKARIDKWLKDLAPSDDLRKWFGHKPERWKEFVKRYRQELQSPERQEILLHVRSLAGKKKVTLVFAARDGKHSNAQVLYDLLK